MEALAKIELFEIVREALQTRDAKSVARIIQAAHMGTPRDFINNENLHLFRQYRNWVTGNPQTLIKEAQA